MAFIDAWLVHTLHKILDTEDSTIRATDGQIMELMASRSGVEIDRRNYYGLKGKFITRQDRPATKCELLIEVVKGRKEQGQRVGIPSEYALGVFGWLLELECRADPQVATVASVELCWEDADEQEDAGWQSEVLWRLAGYPPGETLEEAHEAVPLVREDALEEWDGPEGFLSHRRAGRGQGNAGRACCSRAVG